MKEDVRTKLNALKERSVIVKSDSTLRHITNCNDIRIVSEDVNLIQPYQFKTFKDEPELENTYNRLNLSTLNFADEILDMYEVLAKIDSEEINDSLINECEISL